jgi:hypothetical protein
VVASGTKVKFDVRAASVGALAQPDRGRQSASAIRPACASPFLHGFDASWRAKVDFGDRRGPCLEGMLSRRSSRVSRCRQAQYAVEAFRLEALDYLLKPIDRDRLAESITRARKSIHEKSSGPVETPPVKPALQRTKVLVKAQNRNFIVDAQDIVYATIDDGLITVVTTHFEGISNYRTIEELQSNLDPDTFWRVHRSYLVNINRIREVIPWFKSSFQLRMDDKKQTEIPVSRVQTKRLRALLKL